MNQGSIDSDAGLSWVIKSGNAALVKELGRVLHTLQICPASEIESPEGCEKRASVACIIRLRTVDDDDHGDSQDENETVEQFLRRPWTRKAVPEILFIKRAARQGDRWTGHTAFPGGRRDPTDSDDLAAAIRETSEEVGLDLNESTAFTIGNLPERIVTTDWGRTPLMVLTSYVFLLKTRNTPDLKLQPSEVASALWVPIEKLLDPKSFTWNETNVALRLSHRGTAFTRWVIRAVLGDMLYPGIRLRPSEIVYSSDVLNLKSNDKKAFEKIENQPVVLWGLTHGVLLDLLAVSETFSTSRFWKWPTFSYSDARFLVRLFSSSIRARNLHQSSLSTDSDGPYHMVDEGLGSERPAHERLRRKSVEAKTSKQKHAINAQDLLSGPPESRFGQLLKDYFAVLRGVAIAGSVLRVGIVSWVVYRLWRGREFWGQVYRGSSVRFSWK